MVHDTMGKDIPNVQLSILDKYNSFCLVACEPLKTIHVKLGNFIATMVEFYSFSFIKNVLVT